MSKWQCKCCFIPKIDVHRYIETTKKAAGKGNMHCLENLPCFSMYKDVGLHLSLLALEVMHKLVQSLSDCGNHHSSRLIGSLLTPALIQNNLNSGICSEQ